MGSVSPKTAGTPIDDVPIEDEEDMTSVMSSDQRKALQKAAKTEKESATLERDTARPPPSQEEAVSIPRAPPVPAEVRHAEAPRAEAAPAKSEPAKSQPAAQAKAPSQAPARSAEPKAVWATWELVAFLLLAAAIVTALRG